MTRLIAFLVALWLLMVAVHWAEEYLDSKPKPSLGNYPMDYK